MELDLDVLTTIGLIVRLNSVKFQKFYLNLNFSARRFAEKSPKIIWRVNLFKSRNSSELSIQANLGLKVKILNFSDLALLMSPSPTIKSVTKISNLSQTHFFASVNNIDVTNWRIYFVILVKFLKFQNFLS